MFLKIETDPAEEAIDILYAATSVNSMRGTNLIQISATASTPWLAAEMANVLAKTYVTHINTILSSKAQSAYRFLEGESDVARDGLTAAQASLQQFREIGRAH